MNDSKVRSREFVVLGDPRPRGAIRVVPAGGTYRQIDASKKTRPWMDSVRAAAAAVSGPEFFAAKGTPVRVWIHFYLPRPKNLPKKVWSVQTKKPDVDKLARAVLDGMTGVFYEDDSQVVELMATKQYPYREPLREGSHDHLPRAQVIVQI